MFIYRTDRVAENVRTLCSLLAECGWYLWAAVLAQTNARDL